MTTQGMLRGCPPPRGPTGRGFDTHLVHPLRCKAIASARLENDKVEYRALSIR